LAPEKFTRQKKRDNDFVCTGTDIKKENFAKKDETKFEIMSKINVFAQFFKLCLNKINFNKKILKKIRIMSQIDMFLHNDQIIHVFGGAMLKKNLFFHKLSRICFTFSISQIIPLCFRFHQI